MLRHTHIIIDAAANSAKISPMQRASLNRRRHYAAEDIDDIRAERRARKPISRRDGREFPACRRCARPRRYAARDSDIDKDYIAMISDARARRAVRRIRRAAMPADKI